MTDISDNELRVEIEKILKDADPNNTTTRKVVKKLEEIFKTSLTDRKNDIDKMVMDFINAMSSKSEDEDEEEEEKVKKDQEEKPRSTRSGQATRKSKRGKAAASEEDGNTSSDDKEEYSPPKAKKAAKSTKASGGKGGGRARGYIRSYKLSPALAELMGEEEMPRHEVVKRVWALIKEKKLYDPNNKQFAICDEALYKVIGTRRFRTFGMMKYLKSHFFDH